MRETPLILAVDDDPGILDLVRDILSTSYRVTTASSVQEAQKLLRAEGCDLVLTDMVMPGEGGMELLKYLRGEIHGIMHITGGAQLCPASRTTALTPKAGQRTVYLLKNLTEEAPWLMS